MKKPLKENIAMDGTILSKNLTPVQKEMRIYLEYAGKLAKTVSEQDTFVKNDKPEGLKNFLRAKEEEEIKRQKELTSDELKVLEEQTRYVLSPKKLGNVTAMFNQVMMEITHDNKDWSALIARAKDEIKNIRLKVGAIDHALHPEGEFGDKRDNL